MRKNPGPFIFFTFNVFDRLCDRLFIPNGPHGILSSRDFMWAVKSLPV